MPGASTTQALASTHPRADKKNRRPRQTILRQTSPTHEPCAFCRVVRNGLNMTTLNDGATD